MNTSLPIMLDLKGMSLTTSVVVWSMIAFLAFLLLVLVIAFYRNFSPRKIEQKKSSAKKVGPKGFGG